MADVTIYGSVCEFCGESFETIDSLVRHVVDSHDEVWDYEKPAEESLKSIKLDKKLLKNLIGTDFKGKQAKECGTIECKFCGKFFRTLDEVVQHVLMKHPAVALSAYQHGGLYLSGDFLIQNKLVENFEEYCRSYHGVRSYKNERNQIVEEYLKNNDVSKGWEVIDSEDEWEREDVKEKFEEVDEELKKTKGIGGNLDSENLDSENLDGESKGSEEESEEDIEALREDIEEAEYICDLSECKSPKVDQTSDVRLENKTQDEWHSCERCGEMYETEEDLKNHVGRYHEAEESCMFCDFKGSQMDLVDHLSRVCEIDIELRVSEPKETCEGCDHGFETADDMRTHVEEHHEGLKSFCERCGEVCATEGDLEMHVERHEASEVNRAVEERFPVERCGEVCATEGDLEMHLERHEASEVNRAVEERFPCEGCGELCATEGDLEVHVERYHKASESCVFCPYKGNRMDLIIHLSSNCEFLNEKEQEVSEPKISCEDCAQVYDTIDDLKTHVGLDHKGFEPEDICEGCVHVPNRVDDVKTHVETGHEGFEPEVTCRKCDDVSDKADGMKTPADAYHGGHERCIFCSFQGRRMDLIVHLSRDCKMGEERENLVSEPEPEDKCEECGDVSDTVANVMTRVFKYHEGYEQEFSSVQTSIQSSVQTSIQCTGLS